MHPLSVLEFTSRVAKRAQYEAFEFTIVPDGVLVRNASHANPPDHEYVVTVSDGIPTACTCPADERFDGACKHRVGVAIRDPVVEAASNPVAADGGVVLPDDSPDDTLDECDDCLKEFPCWECVRTGREELP